VWRCIAPRMAHPVSRPVSASRGLPTVADRHKGHAPEDPQCPETLLSTRRLHTQPTRANRKDLQQDRSRLSEVSLPHPQARGFLPMALTRERHSAVRVIPPPKSVHMVRRY